MSSRVWSVLGLVALSACGGAALPDLAGKAGLPDASWVNTYFATFDRVVAAAGLRPLRDARLAPGEREVQVWIGAALGYPRDLYRVVERGDTVEGELIRYWPVSRDIPPDPSDPSLHQWMVEFERGRCDGFTRRNGYGVCRALFTRPPDWAAVLREAGAAGLWTLPDPSALSGPRWMTIDGAAIVVELRTDSTYRAYHYHFPAARRSWPEGKQAGAIFGTFLSVRHLMPPRPGEEMEPLPRDRVR